VLLSTFGPDKTSEDNITTENHLKTVAVYGVNREGGGGEKVLDVRETTRKGVSSPFPPGRTSLFDTIGRQVHCCTAPHAPRLALAPSPESGEPLLHNWSTAAFCCISAHLEFAPQF
jgi:hypothetical protein